MDVPLPKNVSEECQDLLYKLLKRNPHERLGKIEGDIRNHKFFEGIDWV